MPYHPRVLREPAPRLRHAAPPTRARLHATALTVAAAVAVALTLSPNAARATPVSLYVEGTVGPAWRVSIDHTDRAPGFSAITGGGELLAGVSLGAFGVVLGGHVHAGSVDQLQYLEIAGDAAAQIFLGERVRARLGVSVGESLLGADQSPFLGAFLAGSFDVAALGNGRAALAFSIRLDVDQFLTDHILFPSTSLALCASFGVRY